MITFEPQRPFMCNTCALDKLGTNTFPCNNCCMTIEHPDWKPKTHADYFRASTDEELAEALCLIAGGLGPVSADDGEAWLEWLTSDVEGGHDAET